MKCIGYLTINNRGTAKFTKNRPGLDWNEISVKVNFDIPDELFRRPLIEAKLEVSKNIIPRPQPIEAIINTKELIEESTGVHVDFKVLPYEEKEGEQRKDVVRD